MNTKDRDKEWGKPGSVRRQIFETISDSEGITDLELIHKLSTTSVSQYRRRLVKDGWVIDSGKKRNNQTVWTRK